MALLAQAFQTIRWREGSNEALRGRFAAVRVRHVGGNAGKARIRQLQWLLIEWPAGQAGPIKYFLSTMPEQTPLNELGGAAHGFSMAERLVADKPVGSKKTSSHAMCLSFPRTASLAAVRRAQRHVTHSITTLLLNLRYALIAGIGQCPCCGLASQSAKLLL